MNGDGNTLWMLREAAKPSGFTPNETSVAEFAKSLEHRGWLYRLEAGPTWEITSKGRAELTRLEAPHMGNEHDRTQILGGRN